MARFLVVDDDHATVEGMRRLLSDDGHEVAPFTAGAHAVDALANGPFDAVITDLEMPDVDGHAVLSAARDHHPAACLVVVTAMAPEKQRQLTDAGACLVLDKPVDYESITRAVTSCRARGGPKDQGRCHLKNRAHGMPLVHLRKK